MLLAASSERYACRWHVHTRRREIARSMPVNPSSGSQLTCRLRLLFLYVQHPLSCRGIAPTPASGLLVIAVYRVPSTLLSSILTIGIVPFASGMLVATRTGRACVEDGMSTSEMAVAT